jgi:predicted ATPase
LLESQLTRIDSTLLTRLPLLGAVLNLPQIPDNDLTRTLDGQLRKSSLESLLVDCLRSPVNRQPLLLVLEDCHWIDPLSYDLLEVIGRAIASLPVLIVMAYRLPELERMQAPAGSRLPHFTEIRLSEFTPHEANQLIHLKLHQLYGAHIDVPEALVKRITERAEGNPFYVEELLNYLQDRGIDPHNIDALSALDLPNSLHSLILSRIDQLTESQKITLKLASVIGRLFRAAMLWGAYTQLGEIERVKSDLDVLSRLELTQLDAEPELTYLFKHIITQEVAYESLPFAMRASLHDQIAQYIERTYRASLDQVLDLLAYHYGRSENPPKKREYLLRAGEAAQATYANSAAIDYYQRVRPLLPEAEQIGVMLRQGKVHDLLGAWDHAAELYQQALQASERLGDRRAAAQCREAIGELFRKQGQYADATRMLEQARTEFEQLGDRAGMGQTLHSAGTVAAQQGDYKAARVLYEISLKIRRELDDQPKIADLLHNLAIVARLEGNTTQARALQEEALAIRNRLGDRRAIALSLNNLGNVALDQGDYAGARARLEEAVMLQREVGDKYYIANALNNLGNVTRAQGDYEATRQLYTESLLINRELGDGWQLAYVIEDIGGLAALQGQAERALKLVGAASALREEIGAPLSPAEQTKLERTLEPARQALTEVMQEQAWAEGRALSLEEAIEYALNEERVRPVI